MPEKNMITVASGIVAGILTLGGVAGGTYLVEDRYAKQKIYEEHEKVAGLSIEQITIGQSRALQKLDASNQLTSLRARKNSLEDRLWYLRQDLKQLNFYQNFAGAPFSERDYTYQVEAIELDIERLERELKGVNIEIQEVKDKMNTLE